MKEDYFAENAESAEGRTRTTKTIRKEDTQRNCATLEEGYRADDTDERRCCATLLKEDYLTKMQKKRKEDLTTAYPGVVAQSYMS